MLTSQLGVLTQGKNYLKNVSEADYNEIVAPNFISSAGSHIRHIIDHYLSVIAGLESGIIDYDNRSRGGSLESDPQAAINKIDEIVNWIKDISDEMLNAKLKLSTEISVTDTTVQKVPTSLARELIFVGSHAVHHYAMINQISLAQEKNLDPSFGIAPATATFMRKNENRCIKNQNIKSQCISSNSLENQQIKAD